MLRARPPNSEERQSSTCCISGKRNSKRLALLLGSSISPKAWIPYEDSSEGSNITPVWNPRSRNMGLQSMILTGDRMRI